MPTIAPLERTFVLRSTSLPPPPDSTASPRSGDLLLPMSRTRCWKTRLVSLTTCSPAQSDRRPDAGEVHARRHRHVRRLRRRLSPLPRGWLASPSAPADDGGMGLPTLIAAATGEMWAGANLAFAMCSRSAVGAVEALRHHAVPALREQYLSQVVSGEWTAAMSLTEPQAAPILSTVRTRAELEKGETSDARGSAWRAVRPEDLHLVGRSRLSGQHRAPRARRTPDAPEGCADFAVPRAEDDHRRRRQARRATTSECVSPSSTRWGSRRARRARWCSANRKALSAGSSANATKARRACSP